MSSSGASALSESQHGSSNRSSVSGISETSKKSKRASAKKQKLKMRKKRQVKEGSPYEEEYLLDILKEEVKFTLQDREEVRELMKALL
jgi:hypothetical protein